MALALNSCASPGKITNAEICIPIPFVDGEEGACIMTVTREKRLVNKEQWAKEKPFMLMINAKYWTDIKKDWIQTCRYAGPKCNVQVESVDNAIRLIDDLAKRILAPRP